MKMPKTLKVGRKRYAVLLVPYLDSKPGEETLGYCEREDKFIALKNTLSPRKLFQTLIHEALHAIEKEYSVKLRHRKVYVLEKALSQVLLDNFTLKPRR